MNKKLVGLMLAATFSSASFCNGMVPSKEDKIGSLQYRPNTVAENSEELSIIPEISENQRRTRNKRSYCSERCQGLATLLLLSLLLVGTFAYMIWRCPDGCEK